MNSTREKRVAEAEKTFNQIFGTVKDKHYGYIWAKKAESKLTFPFDVSDAAERKKMAERAIALSDNGADVYFSVNLTNTAPAKHSRAKREQIALQTAIVADIDILGGNHVDGRDKKGKMKYYPPTFDDAKSFLPFTPSITVNSGYGLHAYCLYQEPIAITDKNRNQVEERNKIFLDKIRANASKYETAVDAVHDLPRVLRVPGTFNYKCGRENAPLCHLVEISDLRFSPNDKLLNAERQGINLTALGYNETQEKNTAESSTPEIAELLEKIKTLTNEDLKAKGYLVHSENGEAEPNGYVCPWCGSGNHIAKTGALTYYTDGDNHFTCHACHNGGDILSFLSKIYGIANTGKDFYTLVHKVADDFNLTYDKKIFEPPKSAAKSTEIAEWEANNGKINPEILTKLKSYKLYLDALTPDKITASNAQSSKTKHALALCKFYDCYAAAVDTFFANLSTAKQNAANALKDSDETSLSLQALTQVSVRDLKAEITPLVTMYKKKHKAFRIEEIQRKNREIAERQRAEIEVKKVASKERLEYLWTLPESAKRNAEIIETIKDLCEWKHDKLDNPVAIAATAENMRLIFDYDPNIKGLFGLDEFQDAPVFLRKPIWRKALDKYNLWHDSDDSELRVYLRETYRELANKDLIYDYFNVYLNRNSFHVVKDYFKNLPKWDGKPRAETYFIKFLRVDDTPYAREVTMNWLTAAVARIFNPGCRYQTALVLQGEQGSGKSYSVEMLGGAWHSDIVDRVDDPHAIDALQNIWIGELKEAAGLRRSERNAIKAFLERSADNRRAAYARRASKALRHCVFVITVNDEQFLTDITGNRRYLILKCHNKKLGYVEGLTNEYISQLWAEVFFKYNEMFKDGFDEKKLELSRETKVAAEDIATGYVHDDGLQGEIQAFVDIKIPPPPVWNLLTKEEHHKFFAEGKLILSDGLRDLNSRRRAKGGRDNDVQADIDKISDFMENPKLVKTNTFSRGGETVIEYVIYGTEERQSICAAEIINECNFHSDRRKSPVRINEILSKLDGWQNLNRQVRVPSYGQQRNVYVRVQTAA